MNTVVNDIVSDLKKSFNMLCNKYSLENLLFTLKPYDPNTPMPEQDVNYPIGWFVDRHDYDVNGAPKLAEVNICVAKDPHGVIFYSTGWKATALEKKEVITDFQNRGFTVITMQLAEPQDKVGSFDEDVIRMKTALFDKESVIHSYNLDHLPFFVITHSAGANVYRHALAQAQKEYAPHELADIKRTYHTAPFIEASGVSQKFNPFLSKVYELHAKRHPNEHAGTNLPDRLYYFLTGMTDRLRNEDPRTRPTHGQIMEITQKGRQLLQENDFVQNGKALAPQETVYISTNDNFSGSSSAQMYFERKNAEIHFVEAGHNPLLIPAIRDEIAHDMVNNTSPSPPSSHMGNTNLPMRLREARYAVPQYVRTTNHADVSKNISLEHH